MKKVVVIGSGIGGLCTAARLLNEGFDVTIIEKESTLGGKVNVKYGAGFKFDLTASILMTVKSYTDIFEECGRKYSDYFTLVPLDPLYNVYYHDGSEIKFHKNLSMMNDEFDKISEGLSREYDDFIFKAIKKYFISKRYFLGRDMEDAGEILNTEAMTKIIKLKPLSNCNKFISDILKDEKLKEYILFQCMYMGKNPYEASSIYSMIPAITSTYGLYYIKGGIYKYIEALEKIITEMGGRIEKNCTAIRINTYNNIVDSIVTDKGRIQCDIAVCNADYPYSVKNLFQNAKGLYKSSDIDKKEYSYSVFMIYLGLNKKYDELNVHNIYINKNFKKSFELTEEGSLPCYPSLYIYYPSAVDDSLCRNENDSVMNIMVRVPNLKVSRVKWNLSEIQNYRNIVMETVSKINVLNDIENHIKYEDYLTPYDLRDRFNSHFGTAFGLSPSLDQSLYLRPHLKSKEISNLYFIGSSTHPGNGVSIIIDGTKVLAKMIITDFK